MTPESNANPSKAEKFIEQLNVINAKKLAVLIVIGFIAYHGVLHVKYGIDSCKWLLSDGRFKGDKEWQPYGCMMHHYTQTDTRHCLRYLAFLDTYNHFVFIGDSRIREIYQAFIDHLQFATSDSRKLQAQPKDINLSFTDKKLRLRVDFFYTPHLSNDMIDHFKKWQADVDPPSVIVAGCGYETIRQYNASQSALESYSVNLTRLVQPIDRLNDKKNIVLWAMQSPVNEETLAQDLKMITNEQIDLYNKAALEVLSYSAASIWSSARLVSQGLLNISPDGLHVNNLALKHDTQILLNMYCNDHMNYNDGTCCSSPEQYTTIQAVTFSVLGICIILTIALTIHRFISYLRKKSGGYSPLQQESDAKVTTQSPDLQTPLVALAILGLIMSYFYLCDRTNFFMKENKYYSEFSFWLPLGYMFALGLFFTEDSRFTKVLHRDQTLELKGWMQLVILIYHMTGATHVIPISMHTKVLISSYLFLSGYGHFCYVWQTGNTGIVRIFQCLFRINFMTVILCLCMNRPYQFYYYVPLLTFWFFMIYLILATPPHITSQSSENSPYQYLYLVLKFVTLFSIITILYMSEVFFEKVFVTRPWKALFVTTDDDIHEWWYRWKLDRYSMSFGLVFAAVFILAQKFNLVNDNNHSNLFSRGIALTATLVGLVFVGIYTTFTFLCHSKQECEEIHSYIVFLPIIGYIVLRNISGFLRTRYSTLFAWFGNISIELFVCQYHIWLAADTHGVLVLIPSYPVLNVIVTSFIFICASHEVHRLTTILLPYAVPSDWKLVLRNFILFLAVLVPIGIHDGMF